MTIEFPTSDMADRAVLLPGAEREGRQISYSAEEMLLVFRAMRAALALAG